ncbi:hypothetical protein [Singulisphaera sp. PoT]|uniref:hypothetical protein n=1 Tax=Singulisphaera sp. PoT TaxID=3411797 RepID=UPI003BF5D8E6
MWWVRKRETQRQSRPGLEAMEGRVVPTTFYAANSAQLAADVATANNNPTQAHTIILANHPYNLTETLQIQNASNLTIKGTGTNPASVSIVAPNDGRAIQVIGGNLSLENLTVTGGNSVEVGGGIYSVNANVTLEDTSVTGNNAKVMGGGIYAQGGNLTVNNSTVSGNISNRNGGGIGAGDATVTIYNSAINNNSAINGAVAPNVQSLNSGGGIYAQGGSIVVTSSTVSNNRAFASTYGDSSASIGAAFSTENSTVTVNQSRVQYNVLNTIARRANPSFGSSFAAQGGTVTISNSTVAGNGPSGKYEFYHPDASIVIKNSTIEGKTLVGSYLVGDKRLIRQS